MSMQTLQQDLAVAFVALVAFLKVMSDSLLFPENPIGQTLPSVDLLHPATAILRYETQVQQLKSMNLRKHQSIKFQHLSLLHCWNCCQMSRLNLLPGQWPGITCHIKHGGSLK
jgi:hypothetical protein